MPGEKINSDWYELNRIIKALVQEMDKSEGPDWSRVFTYSQDLMALSQAALRSSRDKNPPL